MRHPVGCLCGGQEDPDADFGAGVVVIGLGKGKQADSEFIIIGSRDGKWRSARWGLLRRPYNGRVGVLEGGECGKEDLPLCSLEVPVRVGGCCSKERGVPHDHVGVVCS